MSISIVPVASAVLPYLVLWGLRVPDPGTKLIIGFMIESLEFPLMPLEFIIEATNAPNESISFSMKRRWNKLLLGLSGWHWGKDENRLTLCSNGLSPADAINAFIGDV